MLRLSEERKVVKQEVWRYVATWKEGVEADDAECLPGAEEKRHAIYAKAGDRGLASSKPPLQRS